jgi:superkiller protein 3
MAAADCAVELDPSNAQAHAFRGSLLHAMSRFQEALVEFDRAIQIDANPTHHGLRGYALYSLERLDDAVAAFDRALEMDGRNVPFLVAKAKALAGLGQRDAALVAVDRAIDIDPRSHDAHHARGCILHNDFSRFEDALAAFDRALELDRNSYLAHANRANVLESLGKLEDALAAYDRSISIYPNAEAHCRRAGLLRALGRHADSLRAFEVAWLLATSPEPRLRDPARAVEMAKEAVRISPQTRDYWNTLGIALSKVEAWQEALDALEKSMDLSAGGDAYDWFFVAMAHRRLGHGDEANRWYEKALAWMGANKADDEDLRRFRDEARAALGIE